MTDLPPDLAAAVASDPPAQSEDKLDRLRALCAEVRDATAEVADLDQRLAAAKARLLRLRTEVVPEKMDECAVAAVELAAAGNLPAVRVEVRPQISANIAASWPPEKRRAAFDWLDADGSGDLIKTTVVINFPREQRDRALAIVALLAKNDIAAEVTETVHSGTLTSWLKERLKKGAATPLDVVGGFVGRQAVMEIKK